jgi:hypothetical protein
MDAWTVVTSEMRTITVKKGLLRDICGWIPPVLEAGLRVDKG